MGVSNDLSREAGSLSHHRNPHRFFLPEILRFYFPMLVPWVARFHSPVVLPSYLYANVGLPGPSATTSPTPVLQLPPCCMSSPPWLSVCAPPTSLNECFFLTPWLSDSIQFDFLAVLVVRGGAVCLPTPPSWFFDYLFNDYIFKY